MTREETITAILAAARRPCPPIVEAVRLRLDDGRLVSPFGLPWGYNGGAKRVVIGYVYRDVQNGTTYGTVHSTEETARQAFEDRQDNSGADFRKALEAMLPDLLQEQADYWLAVHA